MSAATRAVMVGATLWLPTPGLGEAEAQTGEVARWRSLAQRAVYFGHQSVGEDITAGIDELNQHLKLGLRIVLTRDPSAIAQPAFTHFHAGMNLQPATKNAAMLKMLQDRPRPDRAIVLLKYCYVDIGSQTDVRSLFDSYREMVRAIKSRYPDVIIVHSTAPLTTVETTMKAGVKRLLGRKSVRDDAVARHRYNALVRTAYAGREPLFDIARVESTRADGSLATVVSNGEQLEIMAEENTRDGGHLNERGRVIAAKALLNALAGAQERGS